MCSRQMQRHVGDRICMHTSNIPNPRTATNARYICQQSRIVRELNMMFILWVVVRHIQPNELEDLWNFNTSSSMRRATRFLLLPSFPTKFWCCHHCIMRLHSRFSRSTIDAMISFASFQRQTRTPAVYCQCKQNQRGRNHSINQCSTQFNKPIAIPIQNILCQLCTKRVASIVENWVTTGQIVHVGSVESVILLVIPEAVVMWSYRQSSLMIRILSPRWRTSRWWRRRVIIK